MKDIASILIAAMILTVSTPANAQQERLLLFKSEAGANVYILPGTVRRTSPAVSAWTRMDAAPTDPSETRVMAQKAIYDCEGRTITLLRSERYDRNGRRTGVSIVPFDDLKPFTPELGSTEHITMGIVCALHLRR